VRAESTSARALTLAARAAGAARREHARDSCLPVPGLRLPRIRRLLRRRSAGQRGRVTPSSLRKLDQRAERVPRRAPALPARPAALPCGLRVG
jgi:hypothetical protein